MKQRFLLTSVICMMATTSPDVMATHIFNIDIGATLNLSQDFSNSVIKRNYGAVSLTGNARLGGGDGGQGTALINGSQTELIDKKPINSSVVLDENTQTVKVDDNEVENVASLENLSGSVEQYAGFVGRVNNYADYYYAGGKIRSFNQQSTGDLNASEATINILDDATLTLKQGNYINTGTVNVGYTDDEEQSNNTNGKLVVDCDKKSDGTLVDPTELPPERAANLNAGENGATFNLLNDQYLEKGADGKPIEDSWTGGILEINSGKVVLDGGEKLDKVNWVGDIYLKGGELTLRNIVDESASEAQGSRTDENGKLVSNKGGELIATGGTLIFDNHVVLNEEDKISKDVKIIAKEGVTFGEGSSVVLGSSDTVTGEISVTGGELISHGFATNENNYVTVTKGGLNVMESENEGEPGFVMNNEKDFVAGDCTSKINAPITINNGTFHLNDVVDPNSGKESEDSIESAMQVSGGRFIGRSILIETDDTRTYNQDGGTTYLTDSILTLNSGSKITGASLVHDAIDVEEEVTPNLLKTTAQDKQLSLKVNTLTMLTAPVRRLNAAKSVGKTIAPKEVAAGNTQVTISNGDDNDATLLVPNKDNGEFELIVEGISKAQTTPSGDGVKNKALLKKTNKKLKDDPSAPKATTFTLNKDSKVEKGNIVIGDGTNENKIVLVDNATIEKTATLNLKENAKLDIKGNESEVAINLDNENNSLKGTINLKNGTLTLVGDLSKVLIPNESEEAGVKKNLLSNKSKLEEGGEEEEENSNPEEDENNDDYQYIDDELIDTNVQNNMGENEEQEEGKEENNNKLNTRGAEGKIKCDDDHKIGTKTTIIGEKVNILVEGEGHKGEIKSAGNVKLKNPTSAGVVPDKDPVTGEKKMGTVDTRLKNGEANTSTLGNLVQKKLLDNEKDELIFNKENSNCILTEQNEPINSNIKLEKNGGILSVNEQQIKGLVTIGSNGNPATIYFTSGQIGDIDLPAGCAIKIVNGNHEEITGSFKEEIAKDVNGGKLIIEEQDKNRLKGDIYQYAGIVQIKVDMHFGATPTLGNSSVTLPYYKQYGGQLIITSCTATFDDSSCLFGDPTLENGGKVIFGDSEISKELSTFSGEINSINGLYEEHGLSNKIQIGKDDVTQADFSIDVYGRSKENANYDKFGKSDGTTVMEPTNGNSATVNIKDFALNGNLFGDDAPIDESIPMKIFNVASSNGITFTSSGTEKLTAIGYYALKPAGNGIYNLELTKFNPGVFRDQIGMTALNQNQASLNDGVFGHILANNQAKSSDYIKGKNPNKNNSVWVKLFGGHENLHLNTGDSSKNNENTNNNNNNNENTSELPDIKNTSYGALFGIDFGTKLLSNCWNFTPSIFAGYLGSHQKYEIKDTEHKFKSRQDGGELGFAGAFSNCNFTLGAMVYGGYYRNKITLPKMGETESNNNSEDNNNKYSNGEKEKINHGLFGGSLRAGYNINVSQNIIIQPNVSATYNYINGGKWKTTYGGMDMVSEKLNGISILPGIDLIFSGKQTSICISAKYVLNLDRSGTGKAGNVELPKLKMKKKGYMQYGLGLNFVSTKNLTATIQATFRHLGRTGFGGQFNLNWKF